MWLADRIRAGTVTFQTAESRLIDQERQDAGNDFWHDMFFAFRTAATSRANARAVPNPIVLAAEPRLSRTANVAGPIPLKRSPMMKTRRHGSQRTRRCDCSGDFQRLITLRA